MFYRAQTGGPGGIDFGHSPGEQWRLNRKSKSTKIMTGTGNCDIRRAKKMRILLSRKTQGERDTWWKKTELRTLTFSQIASLSEHGRGERGAEGKVGKFRTVKGSISVLVHSGYYKQNTMDCVFINSRNLFLIVPEAGKSKIKAPADLVSEGSLPGL